MVTARAEMQRDKGLKFNIRVGGVEFPGFPLFRVSAIIWWFGEKFHLNRRAG